VFSFQKRLISKIWMSEKTLLDKQSGLNYYLSSKTYPFDTATINSIQITEKTSISISTLEITSIHGGDTSKSIAQIGVKLPPKSPVIVLPKSLYPLKVSGDCHIKGYLSIPFGRIEKYSGLGTANNSDLKNAIPKINKSTKLPPPILGSGKKRIIKYVENLSNLPESTSFLLPTQTFFSTDIITIDKPYSGNLLIESTKQIIITTSASLHLVTLKAPTIIIEDNWTGTASLIAKDNIEIGNNVSFDYPSTIIITDYNPSNLSFILPLSCSISGAIDIRGEPSSIPPQISGQINGSFYSHIPIIFDGTISGQIWTPSFSFKTSGSSYINLIQNASFDSQFQSENIPISIFYPKMTKTFIQWLK
jgi:hypothetical protein